MKKIGLFTEIFPPFHGGSGRWFSEIYSRLPKGSVVAFVGKQAGSDEYDRSFPHPVHRLSLSHPLWGICSLTGIKYYFRVWRTMRKLAWEEGVNEIHCGRILPEGLVALFVKITSKVPYVCYVHGEDVEGALLSGELTLLTRMVFRHALRVICNSENTQSILQQKWNATQDQLTVMTPGVDTDRFYPAENNDRPEGWGRRPVVLTVGRLQKRKGHDMMIRALPKIVQKFPDFLYVVVGGGEELPSLVSLCKELDVESHVNFIGEVHDSEMVDFYRHCDLFALPNRKVGNDYEGFGIVLLEAQSCGTAVLAGDSGGTRETMIVNETGVLVDCTSPDSLGDAVASLLQQPERLADMGKRGRLLMTERFSWEQLSAHAINLFKITE